MLMNSVDPDVAERPESLLASSDVGVVAADWSAFRTISDSLRSLASDATLLVQQGKMAGVIHANEDSPRALILDSDPAAGWAYIGPQFFLPEAHEILVAAKQKHFGGELRGRLIAGLGMSGPRAALPLAATMNGAACLGIDADSERIKRCVKAGYCDVMVNDFDEALRILKNAVRKHEAASVGLIGSPAGVLSEMASRGVVPDLLADAAANQEAETPERLQHAIRALQALGSIIFKPFSSNEDSGSLHWVALSGEAIDIQRIDRLLLELFPDDELLGRWIRALQRRVRHQGLPGRACSLTAEQRSRFGVAVNRLVAGGEIKAPIVIARQAPVYLNGKGGSSRTHELVPPSGGELATLLELSGSATWASIHRDQHGSARVTAQAIMADGTSERDTRIERVLTAGLFR
jgi:urocanate hydratase